MVSARWQRVNMSIRAQGKADHLPAPPPDGVVI